MDLINLKLFFKKCDDSVDLPNTGRLLVNLCSFFSKSTVSLLRSTSSKSCSESLNFLSVCPCLAIKLTNLFCCIFIMLSYF